MSPSQTSSPRRAVVVGAGIVGVCTALALQRDGWNVTVLDPDGPAAGASYGNAGLVLTSAVNPLAMPGVLAAVPRMLFDPDGALVVRGPYLPRALPWLARLIQSSTPARVEAIAKALASMLELALEAHQALLGEAGLEAMLVRRGVLVPYTGEAAFRAAQPELALKRRHGVRLEILDAEAIPQMVPALATGARRAVFYPDAGHVTDPAGLTVGLATRVERDSGEIVRERVEGFDAEGSRVRAVRTTAGVRECEAVVVAAGAWSGQLARALGCPVPLDTERGYHVMAPEPGVELPMPIISGDLRFAMTPMAGGIRLAGTIEIAGLEAPPDPRRHALIERHARTLLPGVRLEGATRWMGFRPSMPDSLPVIGRAPRFANAWLAFGHGHLGLTMGPITGRAIADLAAGRPAPFDPSPFRPERF